MNCKYIVEIIEKKTNKVISNMSNIGTYRQADKIKRGASINLNHADFKVEISVDKTNKE